MSAPTSSPKMEAMYLLLVKRNDPKNGLSWSQKKEMKVSLNNPRIRALSQGPVPALGFELSKYVYDELLVGDGKWAGWKVHALMHNDGTAEAKVVLVRKARD